MTGFNLSDALQEAEAGMLGAGDNSLLHWDELAGTTYPAHGGIEFAEYIEEGERYATHERTIDFPNARLVIGRTDRGHMEIWVTQL
jgi:hypothetical protein